MNFRSTFFGILVSGFFSLSVAAQASPFVGAAAALAARDSLIQEIAVGRTDEASEKVLNRIVGEGLDALAREGQPELAAHYREIWEHHFARELSHHLTVIGDHDPLSLYLVDLYGVLSKMLGKKSKYAGLLADLNTMNYAIPVVFSPRGSWRKGPIGKDRKEYSLHFVPFSGIVTFYTTLEVCRAAASAEGLGVLGQKFCPTIAVRLEKEMRARLAPKLSDYVFNRANGITTFLDLTDRDFIYHDASSLEVSLR